MQGGIDRRVRTYEEQLGAPVGESVAGHSGCRGVDRETAYGVLAVGTISVALIGQPGLSRPVLFAIVFIAAWCIVGGQPGLNALSSSCYPTYLRSTGVGAGLGVGRLGAIVGPMIGNALVAQQFAPQQLLWAAAVPAAISTAVAATLWFALGPTPKPADAPSATAAPLAH